MSEQSHQFPKWAPQVGVGFLAVTVLFLMVLVVAGVVFGKSVPDSARFLVVAILALSVAVGGAFLGGSAVAEGRLNIPGSKEHPMRYTLTGGIAVFAVLLMLGMGVYKPTGIDGAGNRPGTDPIGAPADSFEVAPPGTDDASPVTPVVPNWRAAPIYGTVALAAGFQPDPFEHAIRAGGPDALDMGGECRGHINASAPDLDLNYAAGQFGLVIYAVAESDVTLIVNAPDGRWYCSDDIDAANSNAAVVFPQPLTGNYNIWVGTYQPSSGALPEAVVGISEGLGQ